MNLVVARFPAKLALTLGSIPLLVGLLSAPVAAEPASPDSEAAAVVSDPDAAPIASDPDAAAVASDPDWTTAPGQSTSSPQAAAGRAVVCAGKAAKILEETDRSAPYLHFGGIQQCSTAVDQSLTVFLDRWNATKGTWVPIRRKNTQKVAMTVTAYGEPVCSSQKSTRYRVRVYGSAQNGTVLATPYPFYGDVTTRTCYVTANL